MTEKATLSPRRSVRADMPEMRNNQHACGYMELRFDGVAIANLAPHDPILLVIDDQSINEMGFSHNVNCRKLSGLNEGDVGRLTSSAANAHRRGTNTSQTIRAVRSSEISASE